MSEELNCFEKILSQIAIAVYITIFIFGLPIVLPKIHQQLINKNLYPVFIIIFGFMIVMKILLLYKYKGRND